jgi:hypothetical protein
MRSPFAEPSSTTDVTVVLLSHVLVADISDGDTDAVAPGADSTGGVVVVGVGTVVAVDAPSGDAVAFNTDPSADAASGVVVSDGAGAGVG